MITPPSARFQRALHFSHERQVKVTLFTLDGHGGRTAVLDLKFSGGSLDIDMDSASWRRLSLKLVSDFADDEMIGHLSTYNSEVDIQFGIAFADAVEWVQVARLRVEQVDRPQGDPNWTLTAMDRAQRVIDFPFVTPYAPRNMSGTLLTHLQAIQDIITTAFPSGDPPAFVVDPSLSTTLTSPPETSFTGGRWDAVRTLATALGAVVHNDHLGRFVIRSALAPNVPVGTLQGGEEGTLVEQGVTDTRIDKFNAVALTCEPPGGTIGIFVYVVDNDPTSPTYYDGPFGRKPMTERNDTITTSEAAIAAAKAILAARRNGARNLSLSAVYDPLLQPLDVVSVVSFDQASVEAHVIDKVSLPLTRAAMDLETHKWVPEGMFVARERP